MRYWKAQSNLSLVVTVFTALAAIGAVATAIASICQVRTSINTENRQLRAYVGISKINVTTLQKDGSQQTFVADIFIKNFGKTPAGQAKIKGGVPFPTKASLNMIFNPPNLNEMLQNEKRVTGNPESLFPLEKRNINISTVLSKHKEIMKPFSIKISGSIDYKDLFDKNHVTHFCYMLSPNVKWPDGATPCLHGNSYT